MGWYDAIKDGIAVAQKADNLPLVKDSLDAKQQIFELINENQQLKDEIEKMKAVEDISEKIERHDDAYVTLSDDPDKRIYCSCCWDTKKMLVQGQKMSLGQYKCPSCGITAFYDKKAYDERQSAAIKNMGRKTISHGI